MGQVHGASIRCMVALGLYPLSHNPFGVGDMASNIWQWCLNTDYPRSDISLESIQFRVMCRGFWKNDLDNVRSTASSYSHLVNRSSVIGFRVLCESPFNEMLPAAPMDADAPER